MATPANPDPLMGKGDFTIDQLIATLRSSQTLVPAKVDMMGLDQRPPGIATQADWDKFWAALKTINAPPAVNPEHPDDDADSAAGGTAGPQKSLRIAPLVAIAAVGTVVGAINGLISLAKTLYDFFSKFDDKEGRNRWTQELVSKARQNDPTLNYLVIYTRHTVRFDGVAGQDWGYNFFDYNARAGAYKYTLYAFRSGVVTVYGDGGNLNVSYAGAVVQDFGNPRTIVFGYPQPYGRSTRAITGPTISTPLTAIDTGFPEGCFRIRATGTNLYWRPRWDETNTDGNSISLWSMDPSVLSQVLYINANGNLCCGYGSCLDIVGNNVIVVQNRPGKRGEVTPWIHPLPQFSYSKDTKIISVKFSADPVISDHWPRPEAEWKDKEFVLASKSVSGTQTPSYQMFSKWTPASARGGSRWTGRGGATVAANDACNLGVEGAPAATTAPADLNRFKWDLEIVA